MTWQPGLSEVENAIRVATQVRDAAARILAEEILTPW